MLLSASTLVLGTSSARDDEEGLKLSSLEGDLIATITMGDEKVEYRVDVPSVLKLIFELTDALKFASKPVEESKEILLLRKISKGEETLSDIIDVLSKYGLPITLNSDQGNLSEEVWSYSDIFKIKMSCPSVHIIDTMLSAKMSLELPENNYLTEVPIFSGSEKILEAVRREGLTLTLSLPITAGNLYLYGYADRDRVFLIAGGEEKSYFVAISRSKLEGKLSELKKASESISYLTTTTAYN